MVAIPNVLLLALGATALVVPRDASSIQKALNTLNSDYVALKQADQQFGSDGNGLSVETAVLKTETDTRAATTAASSSSKLSESDTKSIIGYIDGTLEKSIEAAIKATEANKAKIQQQGLSGAVKGGFQDLKSGTDSLGQAMQAKIPSDRASSLKAAIAKIDADFNEGISQFS